MEEQHRLNVWALHCYSGKRVIADPHRELVSLLQSRAEMVEVLNEIKQVLKLFNPSVDPDKRPVAALREILDLHQGSVSLGIQQITELMDSLSSRYGESAKCKNLDFFPRLSLLLKRGAGYTVEPVQEAELVEVVAETPVEVPVSEIPVPEEEPEDPLSDWSREQLEDFKRRLGL